MSMTPLRAVLATGLVATTLAVAGPALPAIAATDPAPVELTIVMPLSVADSGESFISAALLEQYTSPAGILTRDLDQVIDRPVTIGIDPMIIASIRVLGNAAPDSAREWLSRLAAADNETFALQWADSDLTAPLQAGRSNVLELGSLEFGIDPTHFSTASDEPAEPTEAPSATPDPDDSALPPLPTTDDLVAWDYDLEGVAWPEANTVVSEDLAAIAGSDYDTTILESGNTTRLNRYRAAATIGDQRVVVEDASYSAVLREAAGATSMGDWFAAVESLSDSLSYVGRQDDAASVVVTLDRETIVGTGRLGATVDELDDLDTVEFVPLADAISGSGDDRVAASLVQRPQSEARIARVERLLLDERRDIRFSSVAEDPTLITGERRARLLSVLSPAAVRYPGGWGNAATKYTDESLVLRQSVGLAESSALAIFADKASLPVTVSNDLNQPVTVYIVVRPLSPLLTVDDDRVELTIEPNSQKKGLVPVASLSNGEVDIVVSLKTATEVSIGSPTRVPTTVTAGWEGPITVILISLVSILFVLGIIRTVLRRRKRLAEFAAEDAAVDAALAAGHADGDAVAGDSVVHEQPETPPVLEPYTPGEDDRPSDSVQADATDDDTVTNPDPDPKPRTDREAP